MDGRLITDGNNNYSLLDHNNELIATNMSSLITNNKLSNENCELIKTDCYFDELAEAEAKKRHDWNKHRDTDIYNELVREDAELIKIGMLKAIELLSDKKFSVDDVLNLIKRSREKTPYNFDGKSTEYKFSEDELIQSLQQREWDVEIEMECPQCQEYGYISECRNVCNKKFIQPKLDTNGCLILKRK